MASAEEPSLADLVAGMEDSSLKMILEKMNNHTIDDEASLSVLRKETDQMFLIVIAIIIFFMQCGFAFLEAGSVRSKNTVNILIKNMLDVFIGGGSYWALGWGLAYGEGGNPFCGGSQFFNYQLPYDQYPKWFFQVDPKNQSILISVSDSVILSLCLPPRRPRLCPGRWRSGVSSSRTSCTRSSSRAGCTPPCPTGPGTPQVTHAGLSSL